MFVSLSVCLFIFSLIFSLIPPLSSTIIYYTTDTTVSAVVEGTCTAVSLSQLGPNIPYYVKVIDLLAHLTHPRPPLLHPLIPVSLSQLGPNIPYYVKVRPPLRPQHTLCLHQSSPIPPSPLSHSLSPLTPSPTCTITASASPSHPSSRQSDPRWDRNSHWGEPGAGPAPGTRASSTGATPTSPCPCTSVRCWDNMTT